MKPRTLLHDVKGTGEPVVLVPGGLTGWLSWIPHQERLAAKRKAIRVQPIHNELGSAGQIGDPSYTAETERESLRLTLDELGIAKADFAGWSAGARALIELAIAHSERVRTLTLVEPPAAWILEQLGEPNPEAENADFFGRVIGKEVTEDDLAEFMAMAGFAGSKEEARAHPNWERSVAHRNALSWFFDPVDRSVEELAGIRAPTLLVKGTKTAPWLGHVVDVLAERLPVATVLELEDDHACHLQRMDEFLAAFERHIGA